VRRDHADVFCTLAEGMKGKRAVDWRLVDATVPRSRFAEAVNERARKLAETATTREGPGVPLDAVEPEVKQDGLAYRHVSVKLEPKTRTATLTVRAPESAPADLAGLLAQGAACWPLRAFRELDDALLRLRFHYEEFGVIRLETRGDAAKVLAHDALLAEHRRHWFVNEIVLQMARVLRRLDATARSFIAVIDEGSCFSGSLLELALAADRSYMLEDPDGKVVVHASVLNGGAFPMSHGQTRLKARHVDKPPQSGAALTAPEADKAGLVTIIADDIDFPDEVRVAVEERVSLSPDALTGMEANLRFVGPETLETKIFGRLSAWQNWIFIRDNATGDTGALTLYGRPERPQFDWKRT
jgi:benzoyl-CoA-dihydrodiol lyase